MSDPTAGMRSPSFRLAIEDPDFMLRDEMRASRLALEFAKTDLELRDHGIRSTVIVFGSARVPSPEQAAALADAARGEAEREAAARAGRLARLYDSARAFARIVSLRGGALDSQSGLRDNVIATGGGPGIMEAANRGATDAGAPSIGFNITLPIEQQPNPYCTPSLCFRFHYFAMRKMHLAMRARALAVFPGGFGTLDEMFEILTLGQTGKGPHMPILLFDRAYWSEVIDFRAMARHGMIAPRDLDLFEIVDEPEAGWEALLQRGLVLPAHTSPNHTSAAT